jgi:hypothetical protein
MGETLVMVGTGLMWLILLLFVMLCCRARVEDKEEDQLIGRE